MKSAIKLSEIVTGSVYDRVTDTVADCIRVFPHGVHKGPVKTNIPNKLSLFNTKYGPERGGGGVYKNNKKKWMTLLKARLERNWKLIPYY